MRRLTRTQAFVCIIVGAVLMHWPPMPAMGCTLICIGLIELRWG